MMRRFYVLAALLGLTILAGCQHAVMVKSEFIAPNRVGKLFLTPPGGGGIQLKVKGEQSADLANAWMRVCSVTKAGEEKKCADTLVLENIRLN